MKNSAIDRKLKCFGHPDGQSGCRRCEFQESCRFIAADSAGDGRLRMIDFDRVEEWESRIADYSGIPGGDEPDDPENPLLLGVAGLAKFFRFILSLDDYTLGLVEAAIAAKSERGDTRSVLELARLRHCSRQAMHRKVIAAMTEHPVLADLLRLTLHKVGNGRSRFQRRRTGAPAAGC